MFWSAITECIPTKSVKWFRAIYWLPCYWKVLAVSRKVELEHLQEDHWVLACKG